MRFRVADNEVVDDEVDAHARACCSVCTRATSTRLLLMDNVFLGELRGPVLQGAPREHADRGRHRARPQRRRASATRGAPTRSTGASTSSSPTSATAYFVSVRRSRAPSCSTATSRPARSPHEDTARLPAGHRARSRTSFSDDRRHIAAPAAARREVRRPTSGTSSASSACRAAPARWCARRATASTCSDKLDADGESGARVRVWDSCQFTEFAEVAHGHNFREIAREPREVPLLPQAVGLPLQVRARAVRRLRPLRSAPARRTSTRASSSRRSSRGVVVDDDARQPRAYRQLSANPYRPWPARITSIIDLTDKEKLFELRLIDEDGARGVPVRRASSSSSRSSASARPRSRSPRRRPSRASSSCASATPVT